MGVVQVTDHVTTKQDTVPMVVEMVGWEVNVIESVLLVILEPVVGCIVESVQMELVIT